MVLSQTKYQNACKSFAFGIEDTIKRSVRLFLTNTLSTLKNKAMMDKTAQIYQKMQLLQKKNKYQQEGNADILSGYGTCIDQ